MRIEIPKMIDDELSKNEFIKLTKQRIIQNNNYYNYNLLIWIKHFSLSIWYRSLTFNHITLFCEPYLYRYISRRYIIYHYSRRFEPTLSDLWFNIISNVPWQLFAKLFITNFRIYIFISINFRKYIIYCK